MIKESSYFKYCGERFPSRVTMGALSRFRKETGRDFLKLLKADLTAEDLGVLLWCAIKSQCKAEQKEFDVPLEEFFDNITPNEVSAWYTAETSMDKEASDDDEQSKKKNSPE
ncbi:MAG: hypothetical protein K2M87_01680 [Muribaculaceae bacterium]|nr:hypothetical protein [Muribaculaceae bacterium]